MPKQDEWSIDVNNTQDETSQFVVQTIRRYSCSVCSVQCIKCGCGESRKRLCGLRQNLRFQTSIMGCSVVDRIQLPDQQEARVGCNNTSCGGCGTVVLHSRLRVCGQVSLTLTDITVICRFQLIFSAEKRSTAQKWYVQCLQRSCQEVR